MMGTIAMFNYGFLCEVYQWDSEGMECNIFDLPGTDCYPTNINLTRSEIIDLMAVCKKAVEIIDKEAGE
ncbi:MAG: hypothetical protein GY847_14410 [Proteobacteria bacterium]|nr:hypothetical protein [Pseudomonadota bacterium]